MVVHIPQVPISDQPTDGNSRLKICDIFTQTYQRSGRWIEVAELCRIALDVRKRVLGSDHPDTWANANYLGILCERQGKYRQPVDRRERIPGPEYRDTVLSVSNL